MTPEFAGDRAKAAVNAQWDKGGKAGDEPAPEN